MSDNPFAAFLVPWLFASAVIVLIILGPLL